MTLRVKKGDVVLFSQGGMRLKLTVHAGQKLLSLGRGLDSSIIHAGIVSKGGDAVTTWGSGMGFPTIQVVHAVSGGVVEQPLAQILKFTYHDAVVCRAQANLQPVAREAGLIAQRWSRPAQQTQKRMRFATRKALMAGLGSANYGHNARVRAQEYVDFKDDNGGPESLRGSVKHNKSVYCSMFVVAVYQAALGVQQTQQHMDIDARNCTPMKLAAFLPQKGFATVAHIFKDGSEIVVHDANGTQIDAPAFSWGPGVQQH